ncbi:hypothetical protein [Burkholderia savannae]|uniref:hypothetical protein n=1 Tax=Burkholderia TaxID=32008 RepID=UPI000531240D|nr:putative outer membrane efflux protein [Burkholderia sp. ABCPW 111]KWZ46372.1 hypothetical protein WS73_20220 [Burkholderia savannae]
MRALNPMSLSIALAVAGLAGCATSSLDMAPDAPDRPWRPQTDVAGAIEPGSSTPAASVARGDYTLPANGALAEVPPAAALDPAHAYTLPELIDLAESTNPLTRIAWNDARNAALAAGIAKAAYLPQLSAAAMGGYLAGQNALRTSLASHEAAAAALVDAAQTTYDAALDAYRHGVGSITDAMLAQNGLLAARTAYADSYSAALSAAASLALATGTVAQAQETVQR